MMTKQINRTYAQKLGVGARNGSAFLDQITQCKSNTDTITGWVQNPDGMLVLVGDVGSGKSFVCAAIINDLFRSLAHMKLEGAVYRSGQGCKEWALNQIDATAPQYCEVDDCYRREPLDNQILVVFDEPYLSKGPCATMENPGELLTARDVLNFYIECAYDDKIPMVLTLSHMDCLNPRLNSRVFSRQNVIVHLDAVDKRLT